MKSFSDIAFLTICSFALSLRADAALDRTKLKRPLTGYFSWLKDTRKSIKGKNVAEVAKKAGAMWKNLPADKKKVFEDRASKAKMEYAAYIAKVKDTEAFKAYKGELATARTKKLKRSVKIAMHKVPMDKSLKKPLSGYMLWFKDSRKNIKGANIAEVAKKAGEMWKSMPADKKKPYADRALDAKKKYAAYVSTGKGAVALKAYKEAIAKARAPLKAKDEKSIAKKAAAKAKAKAKAAANKLKVKALKEKRKAKAAALKAVKAAKIAKLKAARAAKKQKKAAAAKAKKEAKTKKLEAKKAAKAKKAAAKQAKKAAKKAAPKKAKKAAKKVKPSKKAKVLKKAKKIIKKAKKPIKKAKKLIEMIPYVSNVPVATLVAATSLSGMILTMLYFRRRVANPITEPMLVA